MHVLFVHQNFPAQFGHIARHLTEKHGFRCTFVSEKPSGFSGGIEKIQYQARGGATAQTHFCSRTFENQVWHSHAVFEALRQRPDIQPDLIVAHSGFASALYLRELYNKPIINYFEFFYYTRDSDMDFRSDLPSCSTIDNLRARTRNAMMLLDLHNCDAGYSPTNWQRQQLPQPFQYKLSTIFDGIDLNLWQRHARPVRRVAGWDLPAEMRIVTYVSRGMESMRGFDIFMRFAKRLCERRRDVLCIVVGEDRIAYGGDSRFTGQKTFKQWVLDQDQYDLSRILFTGRIPTPDLAQLLSLTDLHVYLTVPFVLSWSLMNALACGAVVLASATAPVREMIEHEKNGLLVDFFDIDAMVDWACRVLDDPASFRQLGDAGIEMIRTRYSLELCLDQMLKLYEWVKKKSN